MSGADFFRFAARRTCERGEFSGLSPVEYAQNIWRQAARPWVKTKREHNAALLAAQGQPGPGESEAFPCEICKQNSHYCPATRYGFEQEGVKEHWCRACKAGVKCVPGLGTIDRGGQCKARKRRMRP